MNGRKGVLSSNPTTTFNTVIDYILADNGIFHKVNNLKIHDFDHLFSDIHCMISCEYEIPVVDRENNISGQPKRVPKIQTIKPWDPSKAKKVKK